MLFNSYIFIFIFLPVTLLVFFLIGEKGHHRIAITWLVGASLLFYGWWNPGYLGLILFSILFNYAAGITLSNSRAKSPANGRIMLAAGIAVNLLLLGYFKYANFLVDTVNAATNSEWVLPPILLPLAISFFTFQQIAYLVDSFKGKTHEYNFLHYCLFVTFFPQLIAGPIVHHRDMLPQFAQKCIYKLNHTDVAIGLTIFFIGLFKKVLIADNMALYATPVFDMAERGETLLFYQAWQGTFAYTLQLYFDFSGYSDMAIGLGRMFGIRLPLNFNSPYQAVNIIDFWRRWHMTLSRFLRDYLYIPLGGNRKGPFRRYVNLIVTMLLGGLWHGAGWTFVIWGGLHGIYLVINHAWHRIHRERIDRWWSRTIARFITLLSVMIGWVFFRAESFDGAINILRGLVNLPTALEAYTGPAGDFLKIAGFRFDGGVITPEYYTGAAWLIFWLTILWVWPNTQQLMIRVKPALDEKGISVDQPFASIWETIQWRATPQWAVVMSLVAAGAILGLSQISEFLYFQF